MKVGLVGRGHRFEALAHLLRNHDVNHWNAGGPDNDGADKPATSDLAAHLRQVDVDALQDTPIIFLCLPIHQLRTVGRELGGVLSGRHVLVHTIRSLEFATLNSPTSILTEETPTQRFGFLTGPFDTADVLAEQPSSGVCASEFSEVHDLTQDALDVGDFRVYRADDLGGAEAAAAYTRVIAMLGGIARQMGLGASLEATLFTRGLAETARFAVYRGGYEKTAFGMSGAGNLHLDTSAGDGSAGDGSAGDGSTGNGIGGSDEARIGAEFMRRDGVDPQELRAEFGESANGLFSLIESLERVADDSGIDLPILQHAIALVGGDMTGPEAVKSLLAVPVYHE
jgi:glycerol-3-phosphate dehydrogenase